MIPIKKHARLMVEIDRQEIDHAIQMFLKFSTFVELCLRYFTRYHYQTIKNQYQWIFAVSQNQNFKEKCDKVYAIHTDEILLTVFHQCELHKHRWKMHM